MPAEVITGPPFSGKRRFALAEVQRRERAGELGLVVLDWTAIYLALVPGDQSALRDEAVSDTGAPRMVGAVFDFALGAIVARELRGYVLTQSPRAAVEIADRLGDAPIVEVDADPGDLADRTEAHMTRLRLNVTRAAVATMRSRCRRQAVTYYREQPRLAGRARVARRRGRGYKVDQQRKPLAFDRALWERGLTPRGREALRELQEQGNAEPSPAEVVAWVLRDRR